MGGEGIGRVRTLAGLSGAHLNWELDLFPQALCCIPSVLQFLSQCSQLCPVAVLVLLQLFNVS